MTKEEAVREWVKEFNVVQQGMIERLMEVDECDWTEVTIPTAGDRVYVYNESESGEVNGFDAESDLYSVKLDNGKTVRVAMDDMELENDEALPMWGTMWSFGDSLDDEWLEEDDGIRIMSMCGFRIYRSEEFGYFFGIDGAGYDFYEAHWIPLYERRGLHWHDPETEKKEAK